MRKLAISLAVISLLFIGCSNNSKNKEESVKKESAVEVKAAVKEVEKKSESTVKKEEAKSLSQKADESIKQVRKVVKEGAAKVVEKTKELAKQAGDNELVQKYAKKATEGTKALAAMMPVSMGGGSKKETVDNKAKEIFTVCAGCHGQKAQNKALGVSKVIAGWSAEKIEDALNGYKNGTYGGAMKSVMQAQASKLSSDDIKAVAKYISQL